MANTYKSSLKSQCHIKMFPLNPWHSQKIYRGSKTNKKLITYANAHWNFHKQHNDAIIEQNSPLIKSKSRLSENDQVI